MNEPPTVDQLRRILKKRFNRYYDILGQSKDGINIEISSRMQELDELIQLIEFWAGEVAWIGNRSTLEA